MEFNKILKEHNFRFNKGYGQNFISDANLLRAIVSDSGVTALSRVLEIGAGAGSLTRALSEGAAFVVSYEIDRNLQSVLEESLIGCDNVRLVFEDFLKERDADIAKNFEKSKASADVRVFNSAIVSAARATDAIDVVANLPYYITTPIIFKLLESGLNLNAITVMVQKEVAQRMVARADTPEYGALSVVIDYRADAKITRIVKKTNFFPQPNVDSAVVRLAVIKNKYKPNDEKTFFRLIRAAFAMRRKTLLNNLTQAFDLSRGVAEELLGGCGIDVMARGETLDTAQLVRLSDKIYELGA
jgi:16S rRNA (adenine1518-N6/adenine1519-N6)-dimethyltransferase